MHKTAETAAGFAQDVDLAEIGQPMFIKVAGREIVVMDAVAFRAMQDNARPVVGQGCICPPTSEKTCRGQFCPRKPISY